MDLCVSEKPVCMATAMEPQLAPDTARDGVDTRTKDLTTSVEAVHVRGGQTAAVEEDRCCKMCGLLYDEGNRCCCERCDRCGKKSYEVFQVNDSGHFCLFCEVCFDDYKKENGEEDSSPFSEIRLTEDRVVVQLYPKKGASDAEVERWLRRAYGDDPDLYWRRTIDLTTFTHVVLVMRRNDK